MSAPTFTVRLTTGADRTHTRVQVWERRNALGQHLAPLLLIRDGRGQPVWSAGRRRSARAAVLAELESRATLQDETALLDTWVDSCLDAGDGGADS